MLRRKSGNNFLIALSRNLSDDLASGEVSYFSNHKERKRCLNKETVRTETT